MIKNVFENNFNSLFNLNFFSNSYSKLTGLETNRHNGHNTQIQETISDFNEFNQLDFNDCKSIYNISQLKIKTLQKIILGKSLDFNGLLRTFNSTSNTKFLINIIENITKIFI